MRPKFLSTLTLASTLFFLLALSFLNAQEKNCVVTPHFEVSHAEGRNIVYCSSFGLAWKMLQNEILKENVKVQGKLALVSKMNEFDPAKIDKESSISMAGFVKNNIHLKIIDEMKNKFGMVTDLSSYIEDPSNIICYSFFKKNIKFNTEFERFEEPLPFFSDGKSYDTYYFGLWNAGKNELHQNIRKQVKVIDYKSAKNFIISLSNPKDPDETILAAIEPAEYFSETLEKVRKRVISSTPQDLVDNDRLMIPELKINISKVYDELSGVTLVNKGYEEYFFSDAVQDINFTLNESGAMADSEAKIILKKGPGPKTLMINSPYLVMMKNKNSENPYFAAWIENPNSFNSID